MQKPYPLERYRIRTSIAEQKRFEKEARDIESISLLEAHFRMQVAKLMEESREQGKRLTPLTTVSGQHQIGPNKNNYSKPILMLIDYLATSGGDTFPAKLEALNRVTLFGSKTAGMGGTARWKKHFKRLKHSQVAMQISSALAYDPNGKPLENNGPEPKPENVYNYSVNDFLDDYQEFQNAYSEKVLTLIK